MSAQILDTAARHPFSLAGLADKTWNAAFEVAIRATPWGPLGRVAETMVLSYVPFSPYSDLRYTLGPASRYLG